MLCGLDVSVVLTLARAFVILACAHRYATIFAYMVAGKHFIVALSVKFIHLIKLQSHIRDYAYKKKKIKIEALKYVYIPNCKYTYMSTCR